MSWDDRVYPVKPGDWVAAKYDSSYVAKVRGVEFDSMAGEMIVDLVIYGRDGRKIGRESPALGGPRTYEPACSYSNWQRIEPPDFPLSLEWIENGDGTMTAGYTPGTPLPDREWRRPRRASPASRSKPATKPNYDPESEAAGRRLAAQELRDVARKHDVPALIDRAAQLEREADAIRPRGPTYR